jgi:hypothetical protein
MCLDIQLHPHHYLNGPTQVDLVSILLLSITLVWFVPLLEHYSMILKHSLKNLMPFFEIQTKNTHQQPSYGHFVKGLT